MSQQLISRNPDLRRLREEGYDIELRAGHLLVKGVPYVDAKCQWSAPQNLIQMV